MELKKCNFLTRLDSLSQTLCCEEGIINDTEEVSIFFSCVTHRYNSGTTPTYAHTHMHIIYWLVCCVRIRAQSGEYFIGKKKYAGFCSFVSS